MARTALKFRRREAADYLGVAVWTFDRMRRRGELNAAECRIGGVRTPYFWRDELDKLVRER